MSMKIEEYKLMYIESARNELNNLENWVSFVFLRNIFNSELEKMLEKKIKLLVNTIFFGQPILVLKKNCFLI